MMYSSIVIPHNCRSCNNRRFSARQHVCRARYRLYRYRSSVRLFVCLSVSHGRISQKRLKLGSCNFHHRVAESSL